MSLENLPPAKPVTERKKPYNTVPVQPAESPITEPTVENPDESTDGSGNRDTPAE